jgi:tetratricopeptide (TPR) repeat protein
MHLLLLLALATTPEDSAARLQREQAELRAQLLASCPGKGATIGQLAGAPHAKQVELLRALGECGAKHEAYFIQLGSAQNMLGQFPDAEATFRRALAIQVTEAAQLGLLTALARQKTLSEKQKADLETNLDYFRTRTCTRDDLCAALAYVAWHVDDFELVKRSSERAMALGYPGWQPWFTAGTVYAMGSDAERARAIELLREAKRRGGPAKAIDGFLSKLGAEAGP